MKNIKVGITLGNKEKLQEELNNLGKNAKINLDLTDTNASLKSLIDGINNLNSKLSHLDFSSFEKLGKSLQETKKEAKSVGDAISNINGQVAKVTIKTNADGEKVKITEFKDSYAQTTKDVMKNGELLSSSVTTNFSKIDDKLYDFTKRLVELDDNGANIDKLEQRFNSLNTNSAEQEIKEFEEALRELEKSFDVLSKFKLNENLKINQNLFEGKIDIGQAEKLKNMLNSITLDNMNTGISKFNTEFSRSLTVTKEVQSQISSLESALSKVSAMIENTKSIASKTGNMDLLDTNEFKNANTLADDLKSKLEQIRTTGKTINVNELQSSLKSANDITASLNSKTKETVSGYKQVENALNGMQTKLNLMSKTNIMDVSVINKLQKGIDDLRGTTDKSSDAFKSLVAQFKEVSIAESQVNKLESAIQKLKSQMSKAEGLNLVDTDEYNNALNSLLKLENVMNQIKSTGKITNISESLNEANDSAVALTQTMRGVGNAGESIKSAFSSIAQSLGIFIGVDDVLRGIWNEFKVGLEYVNQLDRDFFDIRATMDITAESFSNVTTQVQAMGKELGIGADAVMEVVKTYANASTTMDEVMAKAKPSLMLSNITGMNTGEVTKAVNGVTNAFRLLEDSQGNAEEATMRLGDTLVSVSQNMNYDFADGVTQLISGITASGNVAKEAGMDIESYTAMLGSMIEATGRSGSEIANGIKMIIARTYSMKDLSNELGITTAELNKGSTALAKYNIEVLNTDGSLKPFGEVLNELSSKWGTMSQAEQNWMAESLAGNRQRSTFITLMNTMAKSTELTNIALESNGTMLDVQAKYMETVEGKMGRLKATSQTFWSTLVNSNVTKAGIDALSGLMETLTKVTEIFGGTTTAILGIGTVITPVLPKIASLVAGFSEAGTVMGGLSAILSSMVSPVGIVIAGFSLLAVGVAAISAAYKDTNERIAEATESLDTFKNKQKGIEANQSLLDTYVNLNKKLENGNLTLEQREGIQQQINEVSTQLGGISSEVNSVLEDGNKTLEEKRSIIQDIINLMGRENAEDLDEKLDPQGKMEDRYDDLIKNYERAKSLKEELDKETVRPEYISQYKEDLEYANEQVKNGYKEIEKYNESVGEMGPYAEEFGRSTIEMSDGLKAYNKELTIGTEATQKLIAETDNISTSLTPIPNHISRTAEEIKVLDELISGVDEIDPTVDLSNVNLDYISDEFIDISNSIVTAQTALEGFIDTYNALGGNLDLMEEMKTNLEQNGYFTDDMVAKILASGNADLIALLDDEGATWENLIGLIEEYKGKQEEAKQQAIDRANEEAKLQGVLEEKYEEEKQRIEEIMELTSKASETSIKDGAFVDPNNSVNQISKVMEMANGLKSVVAEVNGQKVMINYDENGYYQSMSNVKEISDGTYASMMNLNGATVAVTMDENGETTAYTLEKITELADGTNRALGEIDGKKYVLDFDANNNIIDMQEVIYNAEEFAGIMEGLDGKSYRVTFDKETLQQDIKEVTKNIDGTYSLIDESSGHPIEIIMNGAGEVIGQIDGVNTSVADLDDRINALNGNTIKVEIKGHEQTISDLNNVKFNSDGTYEAIGMLNGRPVRVKFDNKGEIIGDIQDLTGTLDLASDSRDGLNGTPVHPTVNGVDTAISQMQRFIDKAQEARGASGEIRITTVTENITRNVTQTATTVSKGGSASGALPKSIDIPGEQIFEPVEATQDVVIMANPIADTSEVEAFDMGSEVSGSGGGDGLSAPIAEVQPMALGNTSVGSISYSQMGESKDKDNKGKLEYELNLYYRLNDVLEDYNNLLAKNKLLQEKATPKEKIKLQQEELALMTKQLDVIKQLNNQYQKEADNLKTVLKDKGFNIDSFGNIINVNERLQQYLDNAEKMSGEAKDNQIKGTEEIMDMIERYTELTNDLIPKATQDWIDLNNAIKGTASDSLEAIRDKILKALKNKYETAKQLKLDILDERISKLKEELASLEDEDADKRAKLLKLQQEKAKWEMDDSVYGKKKVAELNKQIAELELEIQKDAINQEIDNIESQKDQVEKDYNELLDDRNLYEEANKLLMENKQEEILVLLNNFYEDYSNIGKLWGESLTDSFNAELETAMKSLKLLKDGVNEFSTTTPNPGNATPSTPSTPSAPSTPATTAKAVTMGGRVKVTDPNANIYVDSYTSYSSGTWKGAGVSSSDTMYVYNMNNGKVALSRTQGGVPIGWIDIKKVQAFATGGYTGDFEGGRLALLHSKERVLSAEQTESFEKLVSMLGDLVKNPILQLGDIMKEFKNPIMEINNSIEINNNFNITNNTPFDLDRQDENLSQLMSRELRRFGKITTN